MRWNELNRAMSESPRESLACDMILSATLLELHRHPAHRRPRRGHKCDVLAFEHGHPIAKVGVVRYVRIGTGEFAFFCPYLLHVLVRADWSRATR